MLLPVCTLLPCVVRVHSPVLTPLSPRPAHNGQPGQRRLETSQSQQSPNIFQTPESQYNARANTDQNPNTFPFHSPVTLSQSLEICTSFIDLQSSSFRSQLRSRFSKSPAPVLSHPSLAGKVTKILTRELVYYILLGTLRGYQKYH